MPCGGGGNGSAGGGGTSSLSSPRTFDASLMLFCMLVMPKLILRGASEPAFSARELRTHDAPSSSALAFAAKSGAPLALAFAAPLEELLLEVLRRRRRP